MRDHRPAVPVLLSQSDESNVPTKTSRAGAWQSRASGRRPPLGNRRSARGWWCDDDVADTHASGRCAVRPCVIVSGSTSCPTSPNGSSPTAPPSRPDSGSSRSVRSANDSPVSSRDSFGAASNGRRVVVRARQTRSAPFFAATLVPFGRDHGVASVGIRCGHSVVQFGAAITRARRRFARRRVRWMRPKLAAVTSSDVPIPGGHRHAASFFADRQE